jgi:hypothetical protein
MKCVLIGDDMFYRTLEGLLLKCLGLTEVNRLLYEVHEGACGTHQSAHEIKWLIRRSGYYWPTMLENCFKYYKGCQACQRFRKIQMVGSRRVQFQNDLTAEEYVALMNDNIEDLTELRLWSLRKSKRTRPR